MDSLSAIFGVLAAGAAAAGKDVASQAVKDLYSALKSALARRLDRPEALEDIERAPGSDAPRAAVALDPQGGAVARDPEIAMLAEQLAKALRALDPQKLEKAEIAIGNIDACENAIVKQLSAAGDVRIGSIMARQGSAVISGVSAGERLPKKV